MADQAITIPAGYAQTAQNAPSVAAQCVRLGAVPPRTLQSLLINAYAERTEALSVHDVYRQHTGNAFTGPSALDQRDVVAFMAFAMQVIPRGVRMMELSPVAALGSNSVLSSVSQKTVLGTIRNTEVVADAVSVLTLEAAKQRRHQGDDWPGGTLGTFHRELRTQSLSEPGFRPHYHALSLVSAERAADNDDFKARRFAEHIGAYANLVARSHSIGYQATDLTVAVSNLRIAELLIKAMGVDRDVVAGNTRTFGFSSFDALGVSLPKQVSHDELVSLAEALPEDLAVLRGPIHYLATVFSDTFSKLGQECFNVVYDLERHAGIGYYQDLCVKIKARNRRGEMYSLADIGTNNWLSRITSRRSDRLMTGGFGTEVFLNNFR